MDNRRNFLNTIPVQTLTAANLASHLPGILKTAGFENSTLGQQLLDDKLSADAKNALIADLDLAAVYQLETLKQNMATAMLKAAYYSANHWDNFKPLNSAKSSTDYRAVYNRVFAGIADISEDYKLSMDYPKTDEEFRMKDLQQIEADLNSHLAVCRELNETLICGGYIREYIDDINRDRGVLNGRSDDKLTKRVAMEKFHFEFSPESRRLEQAMAAAVLKIKALQDHLQAYPEFLTTYQAGKLPAIMEGREFKEAMQPVEEAPSAKKGRGIFKLWGKKSHTEATPAPEQSAKLGK